MRYQIPRRPSALSLHTNCIQLTAVTLAKLTAGKSLVPELPGGLALTLFCGIISPCVSDHDIYYLGFS
jgi:hypothetical protein